MNIEKKVAPMIFRQTFRTVYKLSTTLRYLLATKFSKTDEVANQSKPSTCQATGEFSQYSMVNFMKIDGPADSILWQKNHWIYLRFCAMCHLHQKQAKTKLFKTFSGI